MDSRSLFRFIAGGVALMIMPALAPQPPPAPKTVLFDCPVLPISCDPVDACRTFQATFRLTDEYHFIITKNEQTVTKTTTETTTKTATKSAAKTTITTTKTFARSVATRTATKTPTKIETMAATRSATATVAKTATTVAKSAAKKSATPTLTASATKARTRATSRAVTTPTTTVAMLETPHVSTGDSVPPTWLTITPLSSDAGLAWQFPSSHYKDTQFVLWADTLRLDVITVAVRTFDDTKKVVPITMFWRGTCAKVSKQLP